MGTSLVGWSGHPSGSESLTTVTSESIRKKVRTREKKAEHEPAPATLTLPPTPAHPARCGAPRHAVTHAHLARPQPAASSDTQFPSLGGAGQVTGENSLRGFLSRSFPPAPSPLPRLGSCSCPACLSTAPDFSGTGLARGQNIQRPTKCRLVSGIRYRAGSQDASSAAFELCEPGQVPSPL